MIKVWIKIVLIQLLYLLCGFALMGAGHGTYIQFPIFYGCLFLPIAIGIVAEEFFKISIFYIALVPIIFFLFSVKIVRNINKQVFQKKDLRILTITHFIGALLSIAMLEISGSYPLSSSITIKLVGIVISLILTSYFWRQIWEQL